MKKIGVFTIIFLILFIHISQAETLHPIYKQEVKEIIPCTPEGAEIEQEEKIRAVGTASYYYGTGLIAKEENNELSYYHTDNLGSLRVVTDKDGKVKEANTFLPYGEALDNSEETFTFTGKELDSSSGLQYFGARYYDPSIGRFITVDPIGDGINWYSYANNNPLKFVDPSGTSADTSDMPSPGSGAESISTPDDRPIYYMEPVVVTAERPDRDKTPSERYNNWVNNLDHIPSPEEQDLALNLLLGYNSYRETGHTIYIGAMTFVSFVELGMTISDAVINAKYPAVSWYKNVKNAYYIEEDGIKYSYKTKRSGRTLLEQIRRRRIPKKEIREAIYSSQSQSYVSQKSGSRVFIHELSEPIVHHRNHGGGALTEYLILIQNKDEVVVSIRNYNLAELKDFIKKEAIVHRN